MQHGIIHQDSRQPRRQTTCNARDGTARARSPVRQHHHDSLVGGRSSTDPCVSRRHGAASRLCEERGRDRGRRRGGRAHLEVLDRAGDLGHGVDRLANLPGREKTVECGQCMHATKTGQDGQLARQGCAGIENGLDGLVGADGGGGMEETGGRQDRKGQHKGQAPHGQKGGQAASTRGGRAGRGIQANPGGKRTSSKVLRRASMLPSASRPV